MEFLLFVYILSAVIVSIAWYDFWKNTGEGKMGKEEYVAMSVAILCPILNTIVAYIYIATSDERGG